MSKRGGRVFVDTNIIIVAFAYRNCDVLSLIGQLYEEIYIHQMVLRELQIGPVNARVQQFIDAGTWTLFDPDDSSCLDDDSYEAYRQNVKEIHDGFHRLNQKKIADGRPVKSTANLGEIHCLAAAHLLNAQYICSNDYEIQEVIDDEQLIVFLGEEGRPSRIIQDTLEDLCVLFVEKGLMSRKESRKLLSASCQGDSDYVRKKKMERLDHRLAQT